jgi:hypothetical protein
MLSYVTLKSVVIIFFKVSGSEIVITEGSFNPLISYIYVFLKSKCLIAERVVFS